MAKLRKKSRFILNGSVHWSDLPRQFQRCMPAWELGIKKTLEFYAMKDK